MKQHFLKSFFEMISFPVEVRNHSNSNSTRGITTKDRANAHCRIVVVLFTTVVGSFIEP